MIAAGSWTTYGVVPEVWRAVADQYAERGALPTAAQVDEATGCGAAAAAAAVEAFELYHELGELYHELGELLASGSHAPAAGPWTTYGIQRAVWLAVANHVAERGMIPAAADVIAATGCGEANAFRAVTSYARYRVLVGRAAGIQEAPEDAPAPRERLTLAGHHAGAVYLDPGDGELVQVLPASEWRHERWGPLTAGLAVVRILVAAPRNEGAGEVAQRDLAGWTLVPERALAALRAGAGSEGGGGVPFDRECPTCPCAGGEGEPGVPPEGWVP